MANLPIKDNPTLNLQMEALTTSTPGHADRFNERYQQLLENDKALQVDAKADSEKLNLVAQWAYKAVLMAQQTMKATDGKEKKAIVTQFLKELLQEKNIALSDTQIEILIEAAVKQMKIQENAGIVIEATDDVEV